MGLVCGWVGQRKKQELLKGLRGVEDASCCTVYNDFRVPKWQMDIAFNSAIISRAEDASLNISAYYRTSSSVEVTTGFVFWPWEILHLPFSENDCHCLWAELLRSTGNLVTQFSDKCPYFCRWAKRSNQIWKLFLLETYHPLCFPKW